MGRITWFLAGAIAATGALVASPTAYQRLRSVVEGEPPRELMPGDPPGEETVEQAAGETPLPPAAAFATFESEDTAELRLRIDETRARVREKANREADDADEE